MLICEVWQPCPRLRAGGEQLGRSGAAGVAEAWEVEPEIGLRAPRPDGDLRSPGFTLVGPDSHVSFSLLTY